jgi:uncharacterized membrane protein YgcG
MVDRIRSLGGPRRGFALLAVLIVLLALFALAAPFLWAAREADRAAARQLDQARARLALEDGARHLRHGLWASYPGFDRTPDHDGLDEFEVPIDLSAGAYPARDGSAPWFDHRAEDLAGRIDLDSAPPQVIANLLGVASYLTKPIAANDTTLPLAGAEGFGPTGYVWLAGELSSYRLRNGSQLEELERGLLAEPDAVCGLRPPSSLPAGAPLLGFEALLPALWRLEQGLRETQSLSIGAVLDEILAALPELPTQGQEPARAVERRIERAAERAAEVDRLRELAGLPPVEAPDPVPGAALEQAPASPAAAGAARPAAPPDSPEEEAAARSARLELERRFAGLDRCASFFSGLGAGPRWQRGVRVLNALQSGRTCELNVPEWRSFNPGSTVLIEGAGQRELGLVLAANNGRVRLLHPVRGEYPEFTAVIAVQARRPVNINSATGEVLTALFAHLKLFGRNERITRSEAEQLAERVLAGRPYTGLQDFLERLVLPSAGLLLARPGEDLREAIERAKVLPGDGVFLEREDALALYTNALNANDSDLEVSTLPFAFVAREVFAFDLRAAAGLPSGLTRASLRREQIELVVPETELLALWDRQIDFEEHVRLTGDAPDWISAPLPVSVPDVWKGGLMPARRPVHFNLEGSGEPGAPAVARSRFPDDGGAGAVRPAPARLDEEGQRAGRMLHFDFSQGDLEGHDLGSAGPLVYAFDDPRIGWIGPSGWVRPFALSAWVRLAAGDGILLDAASALDGDRVALSQQGGQLRLTLWDGPGDHPDTPFVEVQELRVPLDGAGGSPTAGQWLHVALDVRGNRPSQVDLRLDGLGLAQGQQTYKIERTGLTRLAGALAGDSITIPVESTQGFPPRCVLRIGDELIEARVSGPGSFDAAHVQAGAEAGFGGRYARSLCVIGQDGVITNLGAQQAQNHPAGTSVELYGYSHALESNLPSGGGTLAGGVGLWRPARVTGVNGQLGTEINLQFPGGFVVPLGLGIDPAIDPPQTLELAPCDLTTPPNEAASGFSPDGGYALVLQDRVVWTLLGPQPDTADTPVTAAGSPLYGYQVLRYSGVAGNSLQVAEWNVLAAELPNLANQLAGAFGPGNAAKAFVIEYGGVVLDPQTLNGDLGERVIVVPISLPYGAGTDALLPPLGGVPEHAQLTRLDQPEATEWVRYDTLVNGQLVRDDPLALQELYLIAVGVQRLGDVNQPDDDDDDDSGGGVPPVGGGGGQAPGGIPGGGTPSGQGGGGAGGGAGGGGGASGGGAGGGAGASLGLDAALQVLSAASSSAAAPAAGRGPAAFVASAAPRRAALAGRRPAAAAPAGSSPSPSASQQSPSGSLWRSDLGVDELADEPYARALWSHFQFRGVLGTYPHAHPPQTLVLPVVRLRFGTGAGPSFGWPGRFDPVFALDGTPADPGLPASVHRAHRATVHLEYGWDWNPTQPPLAVLPLVGLVEPEPPQVQQFGWVAMTAPLGVPVPAGAPGQDPSEMRGVARLSKFPSGELPRRFADVSLGRAAGGLPGYPGVIDEVAFGHTDFGQGLLPGQGFAGAALLLALPVGEEETDWVLRPSEIRTALGELGLPNAGGALSNLPTDGGLLRLGQELVLYQSVSPANGGLVIAPGGRGALGTVAQPHPAGTPIEFLSTVEVSNLAAPLDPDGAEIQIADASGFPDSGLLLIDQELVHFTQRAGTLLRQPRGSSEPGARDGRGPALLRGRFGTQAASHAAGSAVVLWPFRYWDRWAERADAPELGYFSFEVSTPEARIERYFFETQPGPTGAARLLVLARGDPSIPWDAAPERGSGLERATDGRPGDGGLPMPVQRGTPAWRVFVQYAPGSFDALTGQAHGWKETCELIRFGATYRAPSRVLGRIER